MTEDEDHWESWIDMETIKTPVWPFVILIIGFLAIIAVTVIGICTNNG